jgi:hypothetical protein
MVLEVGEPRPVRLVRVAEAWDLFNDTVRFWEVLAWPSPTYEGTLAGDAPAVLRSRSSS